MHVRLKKNIHISSENVFLAIAIVALIEPRYFDVVIWLDKSFIVLKIITSVIVILLFLLYQKKLSVILVLIICFEGLCFLSTAIFSGDFKTFFVSGAYLVIFSVLTELMIQYDVKKYLKTLSIILTIYAYLNLLTYLLWPTGLYENEYLWPCYFLGHRNVANSILIPALGITALDAYVNHDKLTIKFCTMLLTGFLFNVFTWSATGVIAFSLFAVGIILLETTRIWEKIKLKYIMLSGILICIFIVIIRIQNQFAGFFDRVLHRSINLTGRTDLWDKLLSLIKQSFLLGQGVLGRNGFINITELRWATSAHNQFIQILVESGIIGFSLFVFIIFVVSFRFDKRVRTSKYFVISLTISIFLIVFQTEVYPNFDLFFAVFILAFHIDKLENWQEGRRYE